VRKGIDLRLLSEPTRIERRTDGSLLVTLTTAGHAEQVEADAVMFATGRRPATSASDSKPRASPSTSRVPSRWTSSPPAAYRASTRWATSPIASPLTPVAIREGAALATTLFGGRRVAVDHRDVPHAVFSQPPVGAVGLTEAAALAAHGSLEIYATTFRPLKNTLSGRNERTLVKLVVDAASQRVVGAHMVGPDAPEIIQGIAIAVKAGLSKEQFDATVAIHPTAAEEFVTLREKRTVHSTR